MLDDQNFMLVRRENLASLDAFTLNAICVALYNKGVYIYSGQAFKWAVDARDACGQNGFIFDDSECIEFIQKHQPTISFNEIDNMFEVSLKDVTFKHASVKYALAGAFVLSTISSDLFIPVNWAKLNGWYTLVDNKIAQHKRANV